MFCERIFEIGGEGVEKINPFPVWIIPFPAFKTSFAIVVSSS